ncbi:hypothetical protein TSC_c00050 [Thermus scotoductus SA-01]|uniref:Uncharacterized protein n=1 Tax=Thermus scotoductus (strain ATCC 700910 / SA-01) TaxID=743525 RepID=E8PQZ8_THESS|nr:hypothetical protein TSC_c00050 [Thermus scotoductus SA-01]
MPPPTGSGKLTPHPDCFGESTPAKRLFQDSHPGTARVG